MKVNELFERENNEEEYFRGFGDFKETLEKSIATEDVIIPPGLTRDQRRDFIRKEVARLRSK